MRRAYLVLAFSFLSSACLVTAEPDPTDELGDIEGADRAAPKVKVCHLPPDNPADAHTIQVAPTQVAKHLAHGDTVGQCFCPPGEIWVCYTGPEGTDMVGACDRGLKVCNPDAMGYGPCVGETVPVDEICGNGVDDDCDGATDDDCSGCTPAPEVCGDGVDDDCDGNVDEGCTCAPGAAAACYDGPAGTAGVGTCAAGAQTCDADGTGYGACVGSVGPSAEVCGDGLDNDCDGNVDEGCVCAPGAVAACYDGPAGTAGVGVCSAGVRTCDADGTGYGACLGSVGPSAEVCGDGLDNDCDGVSEEGCCVPSAEVCGDGVDNDCDGRTDEACIGDRAWNDRNRNGIQDAGETGLAGATFILRTSVGSVVAVAVSDPAGSYYFSNIPAGVYYIEVISPFMLGLSPMDQGGNDNLDNDFDGESGATSTFSFPVNGTITNVDAGFFSTIES